MFYVRVSDSMFMSNASCLCSMYDVLIYMFEICVYFYCLVLCARFMSASMSMLLCPACDLYVLVYDDYMYV